MILSGTHTINSLERCRNLSDFGRTLEQYFCDVLKEINEVIDEGFVDGRGTVPWRRLYS